jgi:hypothetical protein
VEELLELRPYREPIRKQHANRAPSGRGECAIGVNGQLTHGGGVV